MTHQRIAIITDAWHPQQNGVVRVLDTLKDRVEVLGHEVEVFSPNDFFCLPCPSYPEIPLAILPGRQLRRMLERYAPTVIHIATEGPLGSAARAWCLRTHRPFTTAYHTKFPEYVHQRTRLPLSWLYAHMRNFHAPSRAVLSPSHSVYLELKQHFFQNAAPWSHGVDMKVFRPQDKAFLDLPRPIHMCVGRVAPEKNLPAFLSLNLPGSKVVVGSGPERKRLMKAFPGAHFRTADGDAELSRYYAAADVFVFPSRTDTFGLVMLEALASGVPVAAFPVTGPKDVLGLDGDGETPAGCLDNDLAKAAARALTKRSEECVERARLFPWDRVTEEFLAVLVPLDN